MRVREASLAERILEGPAKGVVFSKARASVMKETKGHYPAPLAALAVVEKRLRGAVRRRRSDYEDEGIGTLIGTPTMRNLVGLFFRMEEVKKETGVEALGAGAVRPRKIARVGVLGAGVMGGGIAQLAADKGLPVRMKDIKPEALALGYAQAARIWKEKLKKRRMTRAEFAGKMALLGGSLDYAGFETCDITIEAVLEKMAVKHAVLAEWEKVVPAGAIFASNTSTLPITDIAANAAHPERVVGMHFFNPVYKMPLVEVIYGKKTDPEVTATVFDLAKKMGKTPVVVKDSPGLPREPHPRTLHRRGGTPRARGGRLHRRRQGHACVRDARRPDRAPGRRRNRRRREGLRDALEGLARPHAAGPGAREARREREDREKGEEGILFL